MRATLFKELDCELGEGPLWDDAHLWFFDILGCKMFRLSADSHTLESWEGERMASAAARTEVRDRMLIATETELMVFDMDTQTSESLCPLEADNPATRTNDGRADRQGGFWIGTMGKNAEPEAGAIYRYYKGELRVLRKGVTIPNSICFSPDGRLAYFSDSALQTIYRWTLGPDGWPIGAPEVFHVIGGGDSAPDGAVVDESGALWVAIWGDGQILNISAQGVAREHVSVPVSQPSCPALSVEGRMYITTAREGMSAEQLAAEPLSGSIFVVDLPARGVEEPKVILP
ncbi:SMP-30/gluconolactonase/LRE family protein [Oceanibium sediminis]|uniref:SMP-30/gluconolactonase/LRE family protein n=1 Tax=Oceanibium sediminis TaxID=2026339 RepID=UPI001300A756|nr:SMP-30/gluconolactonase/LRE family protein [Oceanibium sediminis]